MITVVSTALVANRTGQKYTPQLWVNNYNGMLLNGGSIHHSNTKSKTTREFEIKVIKS